MPVVGASHDRVACRHPFKGIDPREFDRIEAACRIIEPRDGIPIFAEGDEADAVYAVIGGTGRVRIGATDRTARG